jgi:hypothetical protein
MTKVCLPYFTAAVENYFNNSPKPYLETIPIVQFNIKKGCDHLLVVDFLELSFPKLKSQEKF